MNTARKITFLGATSTIAKSLILRCEKLPDAELTLFARDADRTRRFLDEYAAENHRIVADFASLPDQRYDMIVNCIAVGRPSALAGRGHDESLFATTEYFENLILGSLRAHPSCLYVNLSSGAVYGGGFRHPVRPEQDAVFPINRVGGANYYQAVRIYTEARHRALAPANIVDLRIFSYFSRFLPLDSKYLLADMISCVKKNDVFETDDVDIVRDFLHPDDLFQAILALLSREPLNAAFDLYSAEPIGKFALLERFKEEFGLKYRVVARKIENMNSGVKPCYYSLNHEAGTLGYAPRHTSLETVLTETKIILSAKQ